MNFMLMRRPKPERLQFILIFDCCTRGRLFNFVLVAVN